MGKHLWKAMLFLAIAILPLAACGGASDTDEDGAGEAVDDPADVATAEEVYDKNCASCHGGDLEGGMGPALQTAGADLSKDEIADIIENGVGQMPAQTQVSEEEREELAAWLADKK